MEVTLYNRTNQTLTGLWNGVEYTFEPYKKYKHPYEIATTFKAQNPIMGTLDPSTGVCEYKMCILEEVKGKVEKLEINEDEEPIELVDRKLAGEEVVVKKVPQGLLNRGRGKDGSPVDGMFQA